MDPPQAYFHSWPGENGLTGRVNPNLYEDGKICLSLLGTWQGDETKGEGEPSLALHRLHVSYQVVQPELRLIPPAASRDCEATETEKMLGLATPAM